MRGDLYVWNHQVNSEQRWLRLFVCSQEQESKLKIVDFVNIRHEECLVEKLKERGRQVVWLPIQ